MSSNLSQSTPQPIGGVVPWRRPLSLRLLDWLLKDVHAGSLSIKLPSGQRIDHRGIEAGPGAEITIHRWSMLRRLLSQGHLGFAEGFVAGDFDSPNLAELLRWAMANERSVSRIWNGTPLARALAALGHFARRNSRKGSRRNILAHYDLGNAFYRQWLDGGMNYSSALFTGDNQTLEDAQAAKNDRIATLLDCRPGDRVLEIGCGWGALAQRLTRQGCQVKGLTLSHEQQAFAAARLAGLEPKADIQLQDYRDEAGAFDRVVSIEMIEAVGEAYWPTYFATLRQRVKPGGIAVIQAITIAEDRFAAYRRYPDFIQKHIFPGGMLPTRTIICEQISQAGLTLRHQEHFGTSYARTIAAWRERFLATWPHLQDLGFDTAFRRKWEYYFAYCEVGFETGLLGVGLYQFTPD